MNLAALRRLHWLLFGALLVLTAGTLLFTTFMPYDDEGYVLFSLQNFVHGGGLYERVYTQYGPFFFVFNQLLHLGGLGLDFTNTTARVLTGFYWLATTGLCGAIVWRVTRSHVAAMITVAGVFLHLWSMTSEPSHPGGLIVFLVALAAWAGVAWQDQPPKRWLAIGAIAAALSLTKINVGVFLLAGAGAWWAIHLDAPRLGLRLRVWLVGLALVLLPFALMRRQFDYAWVTTFALVVGAAGAAVALAAGAGATPLTRWRDAAWVAIAGALVTVVTALAILVQGTSAHALIDGVVLGPLRHPQVFLSQVNWRAGALPLALTSLALASGCVAWLRSRAGGMIAIIRLATLTWYLLAWIFTGLIHPHAFAMSYALTLAWPFVFPLGNDANTQPARSWLGLLLITQSLHAFPVAGSQISWGTFLWVPLAAIAAHDAYRLLTSTTSLARRGLGCAATALLIGLTVRCVQSAHLGVERVRTSAPLRLPGADALLLPENLSTTLRMLCRNAAVHADVLFSMPGMESFHLWTGVPAPTPANVTHWFTLLSAEQQEAIRVRLAASPRSCVIVQTDLIDYLVRTGITTESPLTRWLRENYERAFAIGTYEFWVRRGRQIAAVNAVTVAEAAPGVKPRYQLSVVLAETALRDVTSIEFATLKDDLNVRVTTWSATDAEIFITPINSSGRAIGPTRQVSFPFEASGLVRIEVRTDRLPQNVSFGDSALYFRDRSGKAVAEARFVK